MVTRFVYFEFSEDGTFNARYFLDEDPMDYGTYTFDGRSLSFTTEGGASECEAGETAHYQVTFSEDEYAEFGVTSDGAHRLRSGAQPSSRSNRRYRLSMRLDMNGLRVSA